MQSSSSREFTAMMKAFRVLLAHPRRLNGRCTLPCSLHRIWLLYFRDASRLWMVEQHRKRKFHAFLEWDMIINDAPAISCTHSLTRSLEFVMRLPYAAASQCIRCSRVGVLLRISHSMRAPQSKNKIFWNMKNRLVQADCRGNHFGPIQRIAIRLCRKFGVHALHVHRARTPKCGGPTNREAWTIWRNACSVGREWSRRRDKSFW